MTEQQARRQLVIAIQISRAAYGRAEWLNGFRVGVLKYDEKKSDDLHAREVAAIGRCESANLAVDAALRAYRKAVLAPKAKR